MPTPPSLTHLSLPSSARPSSPRFCLPTLLPPPLSFPHPIQPAQFLSLKVGTVIASNISSSSSAMQEGRIPTPGRRMLPSIAACVLRRDVRACCDKRVARRSSSMYLHACSGELGARVLRPSERARVLRYGALRSSARPYPPPPPAIGLLPPMHPFIAILYLSFYPLPSPHPPSPLLIIKNTQAHPSRNAGAPRFAFKLRPACARAGTRRPRDRGRHGGAPDAQRHPSPSPY
ncbi:hypothetical protein C8J57DRAFT_1537605 [Mycena rebaudengoi]|nr:hypothetical protein C8J57DRAFT_1537605 [Mycena rebaudengoi]